MHSILHCSWNTGPFHGNEILQYDHSVSPEKAACLALARGRAWWEEHRPGVSQPLNNFSVVAVFRDQRRTGGLTGKIQDGKLI